MVNRTDFEPIIIDDFNHDPINQEKVQSYPPELVGRFNSFIVTAFDDSMTVEMQLRTLIKWIKENIDVTTNALDNMEAFKQDSMAFQNHVKDTLVNLINQFTDQFDDNLQFEMQEILKQWDDEGYLQSLINEYTNERIDTLNLEVINARGSKTTLGERLDETTNQLAEKASKAELQQISLSYKESYANLTDLQSAYPTGDAYNHVVLADGMIYTYTNSWVSTGVQANGTGIANRTITDEKIALGSNIVLKKPVKNMIDLSKLTSDYYVDYTTGKFSNVVGFSITEYIPVLPETTYTLSNPNYTLEQFATYDENKNHVSGWFESGKQEVTYTTGLNEHYIVITLKDGRHAKTQLEKGDVATFFEPYKRVVKIDEIEKNKLSADYFDNDLRKRLNVPKTILTVSPDGSKQFVSLRNALASTSQASETNQYEVRVYPGIYDVMSYYTPSEIDATSFIGLIIPDYVSIVGVGEPDEVWIKGELADGTHNSTTMSRVSTLVRYGNGSIENVKVTARNLRYAVHDDYSFPNAIGYTKNCKFYKYKSDVFTNYPQAYGAGTFSGMKRYFENCYTYTDQASYSLSFHNNISFSRPSELNFINCDFDNKGSTIAVNFGSMGSGQRDKIIMTGCRLKGRLQLSEGIAGVGCDFDLTGSNNDKVPYVISSTNESQYVYNFVGEHLRVYNSDVSIIPKGTPVKLSLASNNSGVKPLSTTDDQSILLGITFQDIAVGESGIIRIDGFLNIADTHLTELADGDKIGIVDGSLAKVTNGEYIGIVMWGSWIKLKF